MALQSYNKNLEDKTANQIYFGCSGKEGGPVNTEIDLQSTKIRLSLVSV